MLNLVWLNLPLRVWLPCVKKQLFEVVFLLYCKGGGGLNYALLRQSVESLKFSTSAVRVSVAQICKFGHKTIKCRIFVLDEALLNLATGVTSSVMTEPNLKVSACSCDHKGSKAKYRAKRQALINKSFC